MSKIYFRLSKIKSCLECPHRDSVFCDHPSSPDRLAKSYEERRIAHDLMYQRESYDVPEWCPLPEDSESDIIMFVSNPNFENGEPIGVFEYESVKLLSSFVRK